MKIALAQINPVIGDFENNAAVIRDAARRAARRGCRLVVFPELCITGYPPRDFLDRTDFVDASRACLDRLVAEIRGIGVIVGTPVVNPDAGGKALYNAAVLFEDGRVVAEVHKRLLPAYDVFDESRYFESGTDCRVVAYNGLRLAIAICEDSWNDPEIMGREAYPIDPITLMAADDADLIINISASPFHIGKRRLRRRLLGKSARTHAVPLVYVNQVGGNDSVLFEGGSLVFDDQGQIIRRAAEFAEDMVVFDTDRAQPDDDQIRAEADSREAAVFNALVMGTRDYLNKCGFSRAVIGLSGGIDSALTLAVAAEALGPENVSTVFMPSRYTSQDNFEDTRQLAENLQVAYDVVPIDDMYTAFIHALPLDLDADSPGITEQNIQARIRGSLLMAYANRDSRLVLSTGNKSEMAVGYCTLYGDMNGGLAVIADVPKTLVYAVSRYVNRSREIIPARVLEKAPSAELKPDQTDQDDLPPYEMIDPILAAYIEGLESIDAIVARGFDRRTVTDVIQRVHRNEYKRRQAAPVLKVTAKAFGEGRRLPIAQRYRPR